MAPTKYIHTFTFEPPSTVPIAILRHKKTCAKISYEPIEQYVDAWLEPASSDDDNDSSTWKVLAAGLPNVPISVRNQAVLHLTAGELGRYLGRVDLGFVDGKGA